MEFKHLNVLLKSPGQMQSASGKRKEFEKIDEELGEWKKKNGEDASLVLAVLDKIPVLYGKQGKLFLMPLETISKKEDKNFLPTENYSVLDSKNFGKFSEEVKKENIATFYQEWVDITREINKKTNETSWSFEYEKKLEELIKEYDETKEKVEEMRHWKKQNKMQAFNERAYEETGNSIKKYQKHLKGCKGKENILKMNSAKSISCKNCGVKWTYKKEEKRFIENLDIEKNIEETKKIKVHYEKIMKKKKDILEETMQLQKKYSYLKKKKIKETYKKYRGLLSETEREEFVKDKIEGILDEISSYKNIEDFLTLEISEDLCEKHDLNMLEKEIKTIKEIKNKKETKKQFEEQMKKWEEIFEQQKEEWAEYKKNIVKNIPISYKIANHVLSLEEVKNVLKFIQGISGSFGYHVIADTLKGSKQKKIIEFRLNKKEQYEMLSRFKKQDVLDILEGMTDRNWIVQKGYDYPKIHITGRGQQFLGRLEQKEILIDGDTEVIEKEKNNFMNQTFEMFLSSLDTNVLDEDWKGEYLKEKYKEKGVSFYKDILQFYKDSKKEYSEIQKFIEETYEEKYKPIFKFYEKTAKNEQLKKFIKEKVA